MPASGIPTATYRFQFNHGFTFSNARALVPYLKQLGISHVYASPIFRARRGSSHGYDVTDPNSLNPELGTAQDFDDLISSLHANDMGLLVDIVPNHMAATVENPWWADLLEHGQASPFANVFDIDWPPLAGSKPLRIVLPVLGKPLEEVVDSGELTLGIDEIGLYFAYYQNRFPLEIHSYVPVLEWFKESLEDQPAVKADIGQLLNELAAQAQGLPRHHETPATETESRHQQAQYIKDQLSTLLVNTSEAGQLFQHMLARINQDTGASGLLIRLLSQQPYQLTYWRTGREQLNYRRFFDVTELAGIRTEDPEIFELSHSLVLKLTCEGKINGLRLDHIDGLNNPYGYLERLQNRLASSEGGPGSYVVVEKILAQNEALPDDWRVSGTTGYDFLNAVNGVFVDAEGFRRLVDSYYRMVGKADSYHDLVYANKKRAIAQLFGPELARLRRDLTRLAQLREPPAALQSEALAEALVEITACLPVYRTYRREGHITEADRGFINRAVDETLQRNSSLERPALDFVAQLLLDDEPDGPSQRQSKARSEFIARWQQFTGPVMAKGAEDTSLYVYHPLVSLNEVGGEPTDERLSVDAFHRHNSYQQQHWPATLNASSTHDTKRSEDVRARINALSEIPDQWQRYLRRWRRWNLPHKTEINGESFPEPNTELLVYQTLLGAWPLREGEVSGFRERLGSYLVKAAREAKTYSSWLDPNEEYEAAVGDFVQAILHESKDNRFLEDFRKLQKRVAHFGMLNSLSQVLLKICSPGIPDTYQGQELWDFSLVDPDDRRPVDFEQRRSLLEELPTHDAKLMPAQLNAMMRSWPNGRIKLHVTRRALELRSRLPELFLDGEYLPLSIIGAKGQHVCAFARKLAISWVIAVVPRLSTGLVSSGRFPVGVKVWGDSSLTLPDDGPKSWHNVFTGNAVHIPEGQSGLRLADVFSEFPVGLLVSG